MRQALALGLIGILLIVLGCMKFQGNDILPKQFFGSGPDAAQDQGQSAGVPPSERPHEDRLGSGNGPASSEDEQRNLESMVQVIFDYTQANRRMTELLTYLKNSGQRPFVNRNTNPYTGTLYMIRTQRPFPGTRYFHAQYFTDENGEPFVQHMSFEFRPGASSYQQAVQTLQSLYPHIGEPYVQVSDFTAWHLPDGLHAYVKVLSEEDIQDHPYNSYSPEDVGTVKVAIEIDIHSEDEEGHGH